MAKGQTGPEKIQLAQFVCVLFDQSKPSELVSSHFEIPADWDGGNMMLELLFFPETGDPFEDGEVVEFDVTYRTISAGETYDSGTATLLSPSYTQTGLGADKVAVKTSSTILAADPNQALTRGSCFTFTIDLDEVSTTYSGDPALCLIHILYQSDKLSQG
jgi:hypothetical protein